MPVSPDVCGGLLLSLRICRWIFWPDVFSDIEVDNKVLAKGSFKYRIIYKKLMISRLQIVCKHIIVLRLQVLIEIRNVDILDIHQLIVKAHVVKQLLPAFQLFIYTQLL